MPDRDLPPRLPEIELADLARAINRPLKRPRRRREQRADLAQIVVDDRLAALKAQRRDQLADALPRQLRIRPEQPVDLVLERIKLRTRRRPRIARPSSLLSALRIVSRCRPVRRWISRIDKPRTKCSRRTSAHCCTPTTSGLPSSLCANEPRLRGPPDDQAVQFSTGAGGPVFTRRRHRIHSAFRVHKRPEMSSDVHQRLVATSAKSAECRGIMPPSPEPPSGLEPLTPSLRGMWPFVQRICAASVPALRPLDRQYGWAVTRNLRRSVHELARSPLAVPQGVRAGWPGGKAGSRQASRTRSCASRSSAKRMRRRPT